VLVAAAVGLVLLAAWQVPQWLDWTRYRATIEVLASAMLGQPVAIHGPISFSLLPQPVVTAAEVNVGGDGPTDLSIQVAALRLRVGLWPLLGGRIDARELILRGPDLHIPWPTAPGMLRPRPPAWLAAFAARIEDGRLTIGRLAFTGIDATLETLDTGALSATGRAQFSGHTWHFTARLTAAGPDGAAGLNATLDGQGRANGLGASFSGQLTQQGTLTGPISGRGPNLAALLPAPSVPFRADGRLSVGSGLVAVEDLALQIGASPATGAVALRVDRNPRLDVAVSASRLDLDAWFPVLLHAGATVAGVELPIGIDLSAESAPLGGGTLERLRAGFELDGATLVVHEASARLPGNAALRLRGHIERGDPAHRLFDGDAWLDAPVLRTTARWLGEAFPGVLPPSFLATLPNGVARRALLSAHLTAGEGEVALRHVAGTLDDTTVSGTLGVKRGEPPTLSVDLSFDRFEIDSWLSGSVPLLGELSKAPSPLDVELRLSARQAIWGDEPIRRFAVDAALEAGNVWLRRIEGTVRQAHVLASARMSDGGQVSGGKLAVTTADATPLAELVPSPWRATPALWHGPAELTMQFAGPQEALSVAAHLALGGSRLDADSVFNLKADTWDAAVALRHPGARRFLAALGLAQWSGWRSVSNWVGDGSLSLVAHIARAGDRFEARDFELIAPDLHARGNLSLDEKGSEPLVSGQIVADDLAIPLPSGASNVPLPLDVLRGWRGDLRVRTGGLSLGAGPPLRDASATLLVSGGTLRIEAVTAQLGSGRVSATLICDAAEDPPAVSLRAKLADIGLAGQPDPVPFDLVSGHAEGNMTLAASGFSPSALLATVHGQLAANVSEGSIAGFDLFRLKRAVEDHDPTTAEAAARDALLSGITSFGELRLLASIAHGEVTLDEARLTAVSGEAQASGSMQLGDGRLDIRIDLQPSVPHPPVLAIHLTGPIEHPNRTTELAALARWMADLAH
jgi:hypothetical protein